MLLLDDAVLHPNLRLMTAPRKEEGNTVTDPTVPLRTFTTIALAFPFWRIRSHRTLAVQYNPRANLHIFYSLPITDCHSDICHTVAQVNNQLLHMGGNSVRSKLCP